MARLKVHLLGGVQVHLDDRPIVDFVADRARALLAYLMVEPPRPHRREALASLLYPDCADTQARSDLRQTLHRLRTALGDQAAAAPFLLVDTHTIQFNRESDCWLDTAEFVTGVAAGRDQPVGRSQPSKRRIARLRSAVDLYAGDFLAGFSLPGSEPFESWILLKQEEFHRLALGALQALADHYEESGDLDQLIVYAQRQIDLEPWNEEPHRQKMRALARSGQRGAALREFMNCRRILQEELGVEPTEVTLALYEEIRAGGCI